MKPLVISPPNTLLSIDKLWAYISKDADGNEGLCAATINGMLTPLIAADQSRLANITPIAETVAALTGKTIILVEFSNRTELREIKGPTS
jgi:hypothetical protein